MRIKIREIVGDGLDIIEQVMPADLDLSEDFLNLEKPVRVEGHLERVDEFVLARLKVTYSADMVCSRCLDSVEGDVSVDLEFEIEFRKGDEFIDLGSRVREEILISYAPHVLCKEDCKGICQGCGAYLNTEECECPKQKSNKE
ncbi:MAG: DUF177 domain-containing protein [Candidatus Omnitrophica bacterium]|nr:DUF177 domain-containing protein [Candidatus Omnitrophota bacterium]